MGSLARGSGGGGGGGSTDPANAEPLDPGEVAEEATETALGPFLFGGEALAGQFVGGAAQIGYQNIDSVSQMVGGPDLPSSGDDPSTQDPYERIIGGGETEDGAFNLPGDDENVDLPEPDKFWRYVKVLAVVVGLGGALYLLQPLLRIFAGVVGE